jgi:hypothetical protein
LADDIGDPDPREFPVEGAIVKHRAGDLTGTATDAQIPASLDQCRTPCH